MTTSSRRRSRAWAAAFAGFLLVTAGAGGYAIRSATEDEAQRTDQAQALEQQVRHLGGKPVVDVPPPGKPVPGPSGKTGKQGKPGRPGKTGRPGPAPAQADIAQAVNAYCTSTDACAGRAGRDATVSRAQVAAALVTYCNPRGDCEGPAGQTVTGAQGPAGPPGDTVVGPEGREGPAGPPPSAAAVAAAVADYCARPGEPCRGATGQTGATGPAGEPGRGITDIACDTFGQRIELTITYSDGTTQTLECGPTPD